MKYNRPFLLSLLLWFFVNCQQKDSTRDASLAFLWNESIRYLKENRLDSAYFNLIPLPYQVNDSIWLSEIYTNIGYLEWTYKKDPLHSIQALKKALLYNPRNEIARKNLELLLKQIPPPPHPPLDVPPTFMQLPSENSGYTFFDTLNPLPDSLYLKSLLEIKDVPVFLLSLKKHLGNPYQKDRPPY
jgi:hypothetical protein